MFFDTLRAFTPMGMAAPYQLNQPILPGWSLISVNEGNSGSPETESAILAKASYGRQLGRIMDVLEELVQRVPKAQRNTRAFTEFDKLFDEVNAVKRDGVKARVNRLKDDRDLFDEPAQAEYDKLVKALADFVEAHKKSGAKGASSS